ncbi:hypothetical protein DNL40_09800 [Xylanimonas oleitrophica]|uniref:Uncharacterized protein n=1 Tax=Xylanimonas oleitrophica TaxID=2607479 RepID=A0A2W5WNL1_9MICO|nr:hypothetical protein DNL40_09800 [Xylanimonas oleitrophica]
MGVGADRIQEAVDVASSWTDQPFVDGDGWRIWGEPVGTAGNDDWTLHLVVLTNVPDRVLSNLTTSGISLCELGPEGYATQAGVIGVITDARDYEVGVREVLRSEVATAVATQFTSLGEGCLRDGWT